MERDTSLDVLRFIALIGIIIVHVQPGPFLTQLRNFDVPLMVFCSGVAYHLSVNNYQKHREYGYNHYIKRRLSKLLLPCWIFLFFFHLCYIPLSILIGEKVSFTDVLERFTLYTDWYVWIIRVFVVIAIISPLIYSKSRKLSLPFFFVVFLLFLLGSSYIPQVFASSRLYKYSVMNLPYIGLFLWGSNADRIPKKCFFAISSISLIVFITYSLTLYLDVGSFVGTNSFKWPPTFYYVSYASFCITLLWHFRFSITSLLERFKLIKLALFFGSHSLWIYYWHIPIVIVLN